MRRYIFIFLLFIVHSQISSGHPIHVSICNIEIEEDTMMVSIKLFKDDFELAIEHNYGKYNIIENIEESTVHQMIETYIHNMFQLIANKNDTLKLEYSGNDLNEEAIWLNYKCKIPKLKKIEVNNSIFLDIYEDQTNLVIINFNGKQNGYRFTYKNTGEQIDLK